MLTAGDRLPLIPGMLLVGALLISLLPERRSGSRRLVAAVVMGLALGTAATVVPLTTGGATLARSFGEVVPGVDLLLRADSAGLVIVITALAAGLLSLIERDPPPGAAAALLVAAAGVALAGFAGNAVLLFVGAEIANVGSLFLLSSERGRASRGVLIAYGLQLAFGLGLLVAAVELIAATGTSDPLAFPTSAVTLAVAMPWGLAGAARLLAVGFWPGGTGGHASRAWLATAAVPSGAAILVRLVQAGGGQVGSGMTVVLGLVGAGAAVWGSVAAWRWQREPRLAGRALLVAATGPVIVLAGLPGGLGGFAAGLVALELALVAAPAWSRQSASSRRGRVLCAIALAAAGGLPIGFGTTAIVLELGPIAALGPAYSPLLLTLGTAAMVAAAAGLAAALHALWVIGPTAGPAPDASSRRPVRAAAVALAFGAVAALLPGAVGVFVLGPLAGSAAPVAADAASLQIPGGSWPGGYLTLALLVVLLTGASAAALLGWWLPRPTARRGSPRPTSPWLSLLGPRRTTRPALRAVASALSATDDWLVTQPGLVFIVCAATLAIVIFGYL
ncbi:MAG: hypothetical protein ABSA40_08240 [Candidatus Dormibacteria bacterium]|jgi:hypothetical protein